MEIKSVPRIVIGGTSSGCGKTTITCALLQALVNRKLKTASFKCGPDYIDTMFHGEIIGTKSSNLDAFFCDNNILRYLLAKNSVNCDISVIEGVMGFYDGMALNTTAASTYETAKITDSPVILAINCKGMANSALAIIKGFYEYKPDSNIKGVILNHMTKSTYEFIKNAIENEFDGKIKVFGYLPKLPEDLIFESRHLGLITSGEIENIRIRLNKLAEIVEDTINIDQIISLANSASELTFNNIEFTKFDKKIRIAVANDRAFCFHYKDNLNLLRDMGADIVYFSPLEDKKLPDNIDGIYIVGGYPELYAEKLSKNTDMKASIKSALENNTPCIAECGGFMYLSDSIDDYKQVGFLPGKSKNTGKLSRFGYVTLTAKNDNLLCCAGDSFRGHEFHYYDCDQNGDNFTASKASGKSWNCVFANKYLYAGYPHIHFYSNIKTAENFYKMCIYKNSMGE